MKVEDASYRELVDYRIELIDRIYSKYYYGDMSKDNHGKLGDGFKNYLSEYEKVTYEIYSRDNELEDYVRIARDNESPYHYFIGRYEG